MNNIESSKGEIVMYQPDETIRLEVRVENETVWLTQQLDVQRHDQQYPPININMCQHNHDRFLIIDDVVYVFGASLKDAGKKLFAYIKMQETSAQDLLNGIR